MRFFKRSPSSGRRFKGMYLRNDSYMICCPARSGSTMLVHLLRSHSSVLSHGEVLGRVITGFSGPFGDKIKSDPAFLEYCNALRESEPAFFLYNYVLHAHGHQAVGFKLKYDELINNSYRSIFDTVRQDQDLKIIFLDRENLLERYVSHRIVAATGVTIVNNKVIRPEIPELILNPRDLEQSFTEELSRKARFRAAFASHRSIETTYERLVADPLGEMNKIYAFIGVSPHVATTTTKKIIDSDIGLVVSNLPELKNYFIGSPFEAYFT